MKFPIGARVKRSRYSLASLTREVQLTGRFRDQLRDQRAERGTVIAPDPTYNPHASGVSVHWDDGRQSHQLDYMLEPA